MPARLCQPVRHGCMIALVLAALMRAQAGGAVQPPGARREAARQGLKNEGPLDGLAQISDLLSSLDPARLVGAAPPLPPSYAEIPESVVRSMRLHRRMGWRQVGVMPGDVRLGVQNHSPADFNPRPEADQSGGS